ncbi:MAG TPA: class I SAM-dependent methyltransferase [Rhodanobacteraceae bacterium]|nr:class I SAM-dependent methyltransferase [Rhodanobacteraceae bacterium]
MNAIPAGATSERAIAERIAARYDTRKHRGYVRGKVRWDPVFAAVAPLLAGSPRALLDIGCGLGLLGQYLRERGVETPYRGIDVDAAKIEAARAAARAGKLDLALSVGSVDALPPFSGDVALLDVLHYLPFAQQQRALVDAAARVATGGTLVIRNVVRDRSWRFRATVIEERVARTLGWMRCATGHFPDREEIESPLRSSGLDIDATPLWGRTPFNSWLFVARRNRGVSG